jgi:hypothetical protein
MWNFLLGLLFVRATDSYRVVRYALRFLVIGVIVAGLIYSYVIFHALDERRDRSHVSTHGSH